MCPVLEPSLVHPATATVSPLGAMLVANTPIDYLDFASPVIDLGSKMGLDATNKWPGETQREWGTTIAMTPEVTAKMDVLWQTLSL